jgi:hypothetical protein
MIVLNICFIYYHSDKKLKRGRNNMNRTILVIEIIFFLIGASAASSTGYIATESNPSGVYFELDSPTVLLYENFSGQFPPEGWETLYWTQSNVSCGSTLPPCANLKRGSYNSAYITSKAVNVSNYANITLRFTFETYGDSYCFYIRVKMNETSPWRDYALWDCPIQEDLFFSNYDMKFDFGPGSYAEAFQVSWAIFWGSYGFQEACLDDVMIYYPPLTNPPDTPVIEGKRRFKEGEGGVYPYKIYSIDPDGDVVRFLIDWGDGNYEYTPFVQSGEKIIINVTIPMEKGTYEIFKIRAEDFGAESDWAILEVIVTKDKTTDNVLLWRLAERYPLLQQLLDVWRSFIE